MNVEPLKFQNKYRISSTRLPFHDYGSSGDYFVTVCTQNKEPWFGEIQNGIIKTDNPLDLLDANADDMQFADRVETYNYTSLQHPPTKQDPSKFYSNIAPKKNSLGSIIRWYKKAVTIQSRKINPHFTWQPGFYDRVIRNQKE